MYAAGPAASATTTGPGANADHATLLSNGSGCQAACCAADGSCDTGLPAPDHQGVGDGVDQQVTSGAGDGYLRLRRPDHQGGVHGAGWRMKTQE